MSDVPIPRAGDVVVDEAVAQARTHPGKHAAVRTFLFVDIRGYTGFTVERGDEAAAALAVTFAAIARESVAARDGEVIELRGDEALAVFSSTRQALQAAADLQGQFAEECRRVPSRPLNVGIGLDAGEAIAVEGGFRGGALNRAARLCGLAGPGEVLTSDAAIHLAGKIDGLIYRDRGTAQLKGFADPVRIFSVLAESTETDAADTDAAPSINKDSVQPRSLPIGGFLGSLPAGLLIARKQEMDVALRVVEEVQRGSGRLLLLAGEPGVGKTRLAQEITLAVRDRDFLIAASSCYEARQSSAFFPFLDVVASLYALAPASLQIQVRERWPYLAALLPSENFPAPPAASGSEGSQDRLLWSVSGFIQAIADRGPVALLLDDLHWADSSSLELLQHLARQTRSDRVLLLGTYRNVEVNREHPLEETLRELERQGVLERISLHRLPLQGTRELMAAALDEPEIGEEFAGLLYERTEGNPFFLQQVLRDLVERGAVYRQDGQWTRKNIAEL